MLIQQSPGIAVSYTHLRAHETEADLVCRLLLEKKNEEKKQMAARNETSEQPSAILVYDMIIRLIAIS